MNIGIGHPDNITAIIIPGFFLFEADAYVLPFLRLSPTHPDSFSTSQVFSLYGLNYFISRSIESRISPGAPLSWRSVLNKGIPLAENTFVPLP